MISFNIPNISPQSDTGILIHGHITVQAAADVTGYNIQYLRRFLRAGKLDVVKIGQTRLIDIESLETNLKRLENTTDRHSGLKKIKNVYKGKH
jgi:hypothetical protein